MIRRWKVYPFDSVMTVPAQCKIIHVAMQRGIASFWTDDTGDNEFAYTVKIYATDQSPGLGEVHVASFLDGGGVAYHLYRGHIYKDKDA